VSAPPSGPVRIRLGARRERIGLAVGLLLIVGAAIPLLWLLSPGTARANIQVMAHRGASAYAPENTLAAFRLAIEQRADWLELDVQQTRDGHLVVFHDLRVDERTDGRGAVRELTLAQLRALDAGGKFSPQFAGERIPTFDEVVRLASEHGVKLFPELKNPSLYPGIEERLAATIAAHGYGDRTIVQSFSADSLRRFREIDPRQRLALIYSSQQPLRDEPPAWVGVLGPEWSLAGAERTLVRDAHAAGRQVVVWTLDTPGQVREAIAARVDGIITNRPDVVRALLDGG
jgi:glycerophosphoryl diester phosphodiesterase